MENELENKESNKHNIFSNINFVKNNKINYNYFDCVYQIKNVSNNLENFIEHIDDSILKDFSISKKDYKDDKIDKNDFIIKDLKRRPFSVKLSRRSNKLFRNKSVEIKEEKKKKFLNSLVNSNLRFSDSKFMKRKYKLKSSSSINENNNNNNRIKEYQYKKNNSLIYRSTINNQNDSIIIGNQYERRAKKLFTNKSKNESMSMSRNKKYNTNNSTKMTNNYSSMIQYRPQSAAVNKKKRPQSATCGRSLNEYAKKKPKGKYKYCSSCNSSKNYSRSLYKTQINPYFDNREYKKLRPKYLMEILNKSKRIKRSYKNELKISHMKKNTEKMMNIAKKEIEMKSPDYHKKNIFKNLIKIKKTISYAQKMRDDEKHQIEYFGPGNIDNKVYIRKKNADLIRFCDAICHMKDEQFYMYKKLLSELYPNLTKNAIKIKFALPKRGIVNEKKMKENEEKINKLISLYILAHPGIPMSRLVVPRVNINLAKPYIIEKYTGSQVNPPSRKSDTLKHFTVCKCPIRYLSYVFRQLNALKAFGIHKCLLAYPSNHKPVNLSRNNNALVAAAVVGYGYLVVLYHIIQSSLFG